MSQNNLNIFSFNVRGLRSDKKTRLKILTPLKINTEGYYFCKKHIVPQTSKLAGKTNGVVILFFHMDPPEAGGVAILLPKLSEYKIKNVIQNPDGRYIITEIECFRDIYTFVNIYAPTQDNENSLMTL